MLPEAIDDSGIRHSLLEGITHWIYEYNLELEESPLSFSSLVLAYSAPDSPLNEVDRLLTEFQDRENDLVESEIYIGADQYDLIYEEA
jgi:hypothetical protein